MSRLHEPHKQFELGRSPLWLIADCGGFSRRDIILLQCFNGQFDVFINPLYCLNVVGPELSLQLSSEVLHKFFFETVTVKRAQVQRQSFNSNQLVGTN
ncbi:MAG: hypothetical protein H6824_03685 [Planctomycetaceae bacterium]|nr:hypothetical protein [Planctomycetaceae bacterium]